MGKFLRYAGAWFVIVFVTLGLGVGSVRYFVPGVAADDLKLDDQEATIRAIKLAAPAVVSITVFENIPVEVNEGDTPSIGVSGRQNRGSGSGFLISPDGLILTNKHVAAAATPDKAEYKVTLNSGKQYYAQFIGVDPLNDLAVLKIFDSNLPYIKVGDSNKLTAGTTVIAIGNSLGRYSNSATKGIVSGLGRSVSAATSSGTPEDLNNVIQTDAEINLGNSGGPLIDLTGAVVGVNVAKDAGGQSIGFSIPINEAKPIIASARANRRIIRARLGVRYTMITPEMAQEKKLNRTSGALLVDSEHGDPAVTAGGPASKVGLQTGDIIFEIDGKAIDERLPLASYINQFSPGKKLGLRVQRGTAVFTKIVVLDEFK